MDPKEIFELIVKADEKLKYAKPGVADARTQQARDLLQQAVAAAREIGNEALVGPGGRPPPAPGRAPPALTAPRGGGRPRRPPPPPPSTPSWAERIRTPCAIAWARRRSRAIANRGTPPGARRAARRRPAPP